MKIVFMGTGDFAVPTLEAVHAAGHNVALVVSQPDRPQGRGLALRKTPVKLAAERLGFSIFQPEKLRLNPDPVIAEKADILVVVAYGQILRENILECAQWGAVNVHASLLPRYRGAAPIQWAIANGETVTGVTTMQLDRGMDTGPILLQEACPIAADDTTATLEPKLASMGATLLLRTLEGLEHGSLMPKPQTDSLATKAPLIHKSEGWVDFNRSATEIVNRLRGFSPWPGAQFIHEARSIRVLEAETRTDDAPHDPTRAGEVVSLSREGIDVLCGAQSLLRLKKVQPESRGPVAAFDFANGARLHVGARLSGPAPEAGAGRTAAKD